MSTHTWPADRVERWAQHTGQQPALLTPEATA